MIPYGVAKFAAGRFSRIECEKLGIEHVWVRILSVYGTNDLEQTLIKQLVNNAKTNTPMSLSGCEQTWDYLYEDDAGRAFVSIAQKGINGRIYNLGSGIGRKLKDFVDELINMVNKDYKPEFGKYAYGNAQPFVLQADISELTNDTGWKPIVSFAEGIKKINDNF